MSVIQTETVVEVSHWTESCVKPPLLRM